MKNNTILTGVFLLLLGPVVAAESVTMQDYNLLSNGMSEAEVLYRLGPYDYENVAADNYNNIQHKTWYYIPAHDENSNRKWITEIRFDNNGRVIARDRYKPR